MCLGLPGKVVELTGKKCVVDIMGATREIAADFIKGLKVGDYVLIHAGCAVSIIDEEEAKNTIDLFKELDEVMHG
jgi:hydrogenase expression/formation protein HypC